MTKSFATVAYVRRGALAVAYVAFCTVGTLGAVELGTEIGSQAADFTTVHSTADLVGHDRIVQDQPTAVADSATVRLR
ncbi:MAG: hypothetical protein AAF899_16425 [Pseudomonadota bacterium]